MVALDLFIALFVLLAVLRGARTGFLAGAFSLVGVVVGASVGSRIAASLVPGGVNPVYGIGATLISVVAFAVLGEVLARIVGGALRNRLSNPASTTLDNLGGATLGLALALVLVWAIGVLTLQSPPLAGLHPVVEQSRILRSLDERMPAGMLTRAVAELDPLPRIQGPQPDVAPPEKGIVSDPDVRAAARRAVRVTGVACGYGVEGSGWVAARNLVVTNAHVVAGEAATRVQPGGAGRTLRAEVVLFDAKNDVAVLRVRKLGLSPLPLAPPRPGESAAVIGFPQNGPLDLQPARTDETDRVYSGDAYNEGPVERLVTGFRVFVRPGNSGGPAVNADGEVVATIFASRADSSNVGYGIPSQLVGRHLSIAAERTDPVSTGGCAN
ncbi:MAG: putative serine protease [uncultured Rubrobacteraceae bacterium]|uniref:Putative serine protease n=1 Tax=uncultured Rubrobacteraceae bacterium TaxID=349277 RepID=A0A6J4PMH4_9ACTN|nr:MAG: putative serine protease [uncultured Rubrobacteraceae bacterium]